MEDRRKGVWPGTESAENPPPTKQVPEPGDSCWVSVAEPEDTVPEKDMVEGESSMACKEGG